MLRDLSETLGAILSQPGLPTELAAAHILFDRPVESFSPSQTAINLFLYDIRENMGLRSNEPVIGRNDGQAIIRRPPLRVACTYLVTAWPVGGTELALQEHRLLGQVLQTLARYPLIPEVFLRGSLVGQQPAPPLMAARLDDLKNPHEFWTAIGNKLRTSITVTVTIALETFPTETAPLVFTSDVRIGAKDSDLPAFFRIGGQVLTADKQPVPDAVVTLLETGISTRSGADGRYQFGTLSKGQYTVQVETGGSVQRFTLSIPAGMGKDYTLRV